MQNHIDSISPRNIIELDIGSSFRTIEKYLWVFPKYPRFGYMSRVLVTTEGFSEQIQLVTRGLTILIVYQ